MLKHKLGLLLLGLSVTSACQANDDIGALYNRIAQKDVQALNALKTLAKDNNARALAELGFIYEYGVAVPVDIAKAITYYEQACHLGGEYGCYNARYFYQYGQGVTQDEAKAKQLVKSASQADIRTDPPTVQAIIDDIDGAKEASRTVSQRSKFIEMLRMYSGSGREMSTLVERMGYARTDILHLAEWWAQDGDPELSFLVGSLYDSGFVDVDDKDARSLQWYRKAAELGQADAQNILGLLYSGGEHAGIKFDVKEGMKWYELAAKQGNQDALNNLGEIYYLGEQVKVDYAKAYKLFAQAAKLSEPEAWREGNPSAWKNLAWMYTNGQYVKADCKKAAEYFTKGQSRIGKDEHFLETCEKDKQARENAGSELPALTLQHYGTFQGGKNKGYACQLHFVVDTNKISEIANLRVALNVKNSDGAVLKQTVGFNPFGMTTLNLNLNGYEYSSFRSSALQTLQQPEFCSRLTFDITAATATINGKDVDVLNVMTLTERRD